MVLTTFRAGDSLQSSPVTGGVDAAGPHRRRELSAAGESGQHPPSSRASVVVLSDEFDGPYVQVDGDAEVVDLPEAVDGLVEYYRSVAGEHPDWDEYRKAMRRPAKVPDQGHPAAVGSGGDRRVSARVNRGKREGLNRMPDGVCGSQS